LAGPGALSFALAGIPIVLVGLISQPVVAVAMIVLWGLALSLADSISNALIHRVVESPLLAPSVAALESSKQLLEGLGALAAPALLAVLGVRTALIVAGAPLPLLAALSRPGLLAIDRRASNRARPMAALRRIPAFKGLTMLSLESLSARLRPAQATAGEVIIRQDDLGDRFYLIDSGRVEVTIDGFKITELGVEQGFGEKALLRDTPRSATVTAVEPTTLWYLDGPDFVAAATGNEGPAAQRFTGAGPRTLEEILAAVPLFAAINPADLLALGELSTARPGAAIVTEGEPGERFYVLLDGEARVTIGGHAVRTLVAGDSFGEIALLHRVPRTATVSAVGDLALWSLDRDAFLGLLEEPDLTGLDLAGTDLAGAGQIV
jgi:CRP-like cAMP-binding protein